MTTAIELLTDAFGRVQEIVHEVVTGLDEEALGFRADADANSIAWLVWHLTRTQDDHVSEIAGRPEAWVESGWHERFGLPFRSAVTGYGQSSAQVAELHGVSAELLLGYFDDVHARTLEFLASPGAQDLDRIVDKRWDPPVTAAVRLVSVISDDLQHAGQAAFVRGLVERC